MNAGMGACEEKEAEETRGKKHKVCDRERGVLNVCRSFPLRGMVVWFPTSRGGKRSQRE